MLRIRRPKKNGQEQEITELIRRKLAERHVVRPFPAMASRLLAAFHDKNATSETFARIIECDAALAIRLVRIANSPLYGLSNEVRTVEHAVTLLGTRSLKSLALSLASASMFTSGTTAAIEREALWNHSLGCATVARLLARFVPSVHVDEAFLAGIFHDIGKLFFYDVVPEEYAKIVDTGEPISNAEQNAFGITHEEIGIRSATEWNLVEEIKVAIGYHHKPSLSPAHSNFADIIHVADQLARLGGIGSVANSSIEVSGNAVQRLSLEMESLETILDEADALFAYTKRACA